MKSIDSSKPEPGFYFTRMVRDGPKVPVVIFIHCPIEMNPDYWNWLDRGWRVGAKLGDRDVPVKRVWPFCADNPITRGEYLFLLADAHHAVMYEPHRPEANPHQAVDLTTQPPIF